VAAAEDRLEREWDVHTAAEDRLVEAALVLVDPTGVGDVLLLEDLVVRLTTGDGVLHEVHLLLVEAVDVIASVAGQRKSLKKRLLIVKESRKGLHGDHRRRLVGFDRLGVSSEACGDGGWKEAMLEDLYEREAALGEDDQSRIGDKCGKVIGKQGPVGVDKDGVALIGGETRENGTCVFGRESPTPFDVVSEDVGWEGVDILGRVIDEEGVLEVVLGAGVLDHLVLVTHIFSVFVVVVHARCEDIVDVEVVEVEGLADDVRAAKACDKDLHGAGFGFDSVIE
jgi:hypothetical protein